MLDRPAKGAPRRRSGVPRRSEGRSQHEGEEPAGLPEALPPAVRDPDLAPAAPRRNGDEGRPPLRLRRASRRPSFFEFLPRLLKGTVSASQFFF